MSLATTLLVLSAMLVLGLLSRPLCDRLHLPYSVSMLLIGFIGSEIIVAMGHDTGIRAELFSNIVFYGLLPVLIFESAFHIDADALLDELRSVLLLSIPVLVLSTFVAAILLYHGIGHPVGFPWMAALLCGALLSATEPSAILPLLRRSGVPKRARILLEGESLFSDGTAIVFFGILLYLATHPQEHITTADIIARFLIVFFGGMACGLFVGVGFLWLARHFRDPVIHAAITLISAYSSYLIAEVWLGVSGVMAVLITAIVIGRLVRADQDQAGLAFVDRLWQFNAFFAGSLVYLLMGVTITVAMFEQRWLAMLIGIGAVIVARALGILVVSPLLNLGRPRRLSWRDRGVLAWGGLRGAVTLALALSIPVSLDYWWTIQSIAFGVVVFSLFAQAPGMRWLVYEPDA